MFRGKAYPVVAMMENSLASWFQVLPQWFCFTSVDFENELGGSLNGYMDVCGLDHICIWNMYMQVRV